MYLKDNLSKYIFRVLLMLIFVSNFPVSKEDLHTCKGSLIHCNANLKNAEYLNSFDIYLLRSWDIIENLKRIKVALTYFCFRNFYYKQNLIKEHFRKLVKLCKSLWRCCCKDKVKWTLMIYKEFNIDLAKLDGFNFFYIFALPGI